MRTPMAGVAVAMLLGAVMLGGGVALGGPAGAAPCPRGSGVTVVVGSDVRCDANGGGSAAAVFTGVGHSLIYVQRQPGFVCQVDGQPSTSCTDTPPADAYWGLYSSSGTSGRWAYASSGVGSLSVPRGSWVAFVFQKGSGRTYPSMTPVGAAPVAPNPTADPTRRPSSQPSSRSAGKPAGKPADEAPATPGRSTSTPTPAATPSAATSTPPPTPTTTPGSATTTQGGGTPVPSDDTRTASEDTGGQGSLGWVAGALALLLVGGMGAMLWRRRAAGELS